MFDINYVRISETYVGTPGWFVETYYRVLCCTPVLSVYVLRFCSVTWPLVVMDMQHG